LSRSIGAQTISEREYWLDKIDALKDEWVIERRIQLLIDERVKNLPIPSQLEKIDLPDLAHTESTRRNRCFKA
jgi:hypothetical protein